MKRQNENINKNQSRVSLSGISALFEMKAAETPDTDLRGWHHAFTLIELLVVVLIIGILSAIALPQYERAVDKAKAAEALTIISSLRQSIEEYILANNSFPTSFDELTVVPSGSLGKYSVENDKITGKYYTCVLTNGRIDCGNYNGGGFLWFSDFDRNWFAALGKEKRLWCYVVETESFSAAQQSRAHNLCRAISGKSASEGQKAGDDFWYALD